MSFGHKRLHVGGRPGLSGDVEVSLSVEHRLRRSDSIANTITKTTTILTLQYRGRGRDRNRNRPDAEKLQSLSA